MDNWGSQNFSGCQLGDKRLNRRAQEIAIALSAGFGQGLSTIFQEWKRLKRVYEFFANQKVQIEKLTQPHRRNTAQSAASCEVVLSVGDTTKLDYEGIKLKREGYGPIGNGGNGLILHTGLGIDPQQGQPLGLLWQKRMSRPTKVKPPAHETPLQKKKRQALQRKVAREKPFEDQESYRGVEALKEVEKLIAGTTRIVHVFDREGDIAEVFNQVRQLKRTGVVVRAAHDRSLDQSTAHLWEYLESQNWQFFQEIELPETANREARPAKVAVKFCPVELRSPRRLEDKSPFQVYAVYAQEVDYPEGAEAVDWMLLTSERVTTVEEAVTILRWYTYRWRVEEYHKVLKSGCKAESYRLSAESMAAMLGFLTVIAVELLRVTYLHRTQPMAPAEVVLNPVQLSVLIAKEAESPKALTVSWAVQAVARLGGYP